MSTSDIISLISASSALIAALGTFSNRKRIGQVHVLVNQKYTDVVRRVSQLTGTMDDAGVVVPADPADPNEREAKA